MRLSLCSVNAKRKSQYHRPAFVLIFIYSACLFLSFGGVYPADKSPKDVRSLYRSYFQVRKLMAAKKYPEAVAQAKKLVKLEPSFSEIYPSLAAASRAANVSDKTAAFFNDLLRKEPENTYFLYGLGLCYKSPDTLDRFLECNKKAIELNSPSILVYYEFLANWKKDFAELIRYFEERAKANPQNSFLHYALGASYEYKLRKFDAALPCYERAVQVAREGGDNVQLGMHLNMLGNYYFNRGNLSKALESYEKAVAAIRLAGNKTEESSYLFNCGIICCLMGNIAKGREYYEQSLAVDRAIGQKTHEAQVLRNIGTTYFRIGDRKRALELYGQALSIAQEYDDKPGQGRYLSDLASILFDRGEYGQALEYQRKGLALSREMKDRYLECAILSSIGENLRRIGQFPESLNHFKSALDLSRQINNKELEARSLISIGLVHWDLNQPGKSLECYEEALKIAVPSGMKPLEGVLRNNISLVHMGLKDYPKALGALESALKAARETKDRLAEANRLCNLAAVHSRLGNSSRSLDLCEQSLQIAREADNKSLEAFARNTKGYAFLGSGNPAKAEESFSQALLIAEELKTPIPLFQARAGLAQVLESQGRSEESLEHYRKAMEVIEGIRTLFSLEEQKSSYMQDKIEVYERAANLLYELDRKFPGKGYGGESFHIAEKAKARAFLDSLEAGKINFRDQLRPETREAENAVSAAISRLQTELAKPSLEESKRRDLLEKLRNAENEYSDLIQRIRQENPEYARLIYPQPVRIEEVQKRLLDEETVLIEYSLGEKNSCVYVSTNTDFSIRKLTDGAEIQKLALDYTSFLSSKEITNHENLPAGRSLYEKLIGPVEKTVASKQRWVIVPDGKLHYLPFEALVRADGRYVVEDYRISYAASASSHLSLQERERPSLHKKDILAFANPLYSLKGTPPERFQPADGDRGDYSFERGLKLPLLRYSEEEVRKIGALVPRKAREIYTRAEATEEKIKGLRLVDYRILHFATHGLIDEAVPFRSSIVLALDEDPREDGFFQVPEIFHSALNAELVVLSACETGKGKLEKGEGVTGLARAFLYSGSQAVVASLWNINDRATAEFMSEFYRKMAQGSPKDDALRQAKIRMIGSKYRAPLYWAGFVLIGDGRSAISLRK